jgi:hypothetical protein
MSEHTTEADITLPDVILMHKDEYNKLQADNARLREALEWYSCDSGVVARAALGKED